MLDLLFFSPFEQFEILFYFNKIGTKWNNFNLYLLLSLILFLKLNVNSTLTKKSFIVTTLITTIYNQVISLIKIKYNYYFPILNTIFWIILFNNLLGLIPYNFTITTQIIYTLFLSFSIILCVTLIGIYKHNIYFITLFIPKGVNIVLLPVIFLIEIISYLSRIISLSIRLSANMISGHILLFILSSFLFKSIILLPIAIIIISLFILLELGVSLIQAYVFLILTTNYLKDSLYLH